MQKIHRFIGKWPLALGTLRIDDAELVHQLRAVLKLVPGEVIILGDGAGMEAQCTIMRYDGDTVFVNGVSLGHVMHEPAIRAVLYCSMLKSDHFELAVQKATEVGITEIMPLITGRTIKKGLRIERIRTIAREVAEVAGRGIIPVVHEEVPLEQALTHAQENDVNFFFDPSGKPFNGVARSVRRAGIWIGPEGGWDGSELEQAAEAGMRIVSLGGLIFRAETAATIAAYLVANLSKS